MADQLTGAQLADSENILKSDKAEAEKLISRAAQGNREALLALCHTIAKHVLFRVMRKLRNPMDAEDVAQEVLIRVCAKIHTLRDPKAFGGWLNSIIANETNRFFSKSAEPGTVLNIDEYLDTVTEENEDFLPEEYAVREDDRKAVMEIVDELPDRQLEAIMLHYYEGLSVTEVAAAMDVTKQSVSRYLMLARNKIKKELEKRARKSNALYSIALLPIGSLLARVLGPGAEAATAAGELWTDLVLSRCASYVRGGVPGKQVRGTETLNLAVTVGASFVASVAIVGGMLIGGVFTQAQTPSKPDAAGTVVFSGGDETYAHLNPTHVDIEASSSYGEIEAQSFTITAVGSDVILFEGKEEAASAALTSIDTDGEYRIVFSLEDPHGDTYLLSRTFVIRKTE